MISLLYFDRATLRAVSEAQEHRCVIHPRHAVAQFIYLEMTPVAKLTHFVTPVSATLQSRLAQRKYVQGAAIEAL